MTPDAMQVTILGATGSVGRNTLDVIERHSQFEVFALTAAENLEGLYAQCCKFSPRFAVLQNSDKAEELARRLSASDTEVLCGDEYLAMVASHEDVDAVMAAIVGAAGLVPTLAAVSANKKVLLANKEALVMAGDIFMSQLRKGSGTLLPIDSEHNAIFQCLPHASRGSEGALDASVRKVILTASGGPFLDTPAHQLSAVTPEQACKHPRWKMGRKISVDSATLMNKGLEFIEACYLFGLDERQLDVLIHPQSIIHSLVEYVDGSVLAQLATPDMRIPIAHGLAWPERIDSGSDRLDLAGIAKLEFRQPDLDKFPCLKLGIDAAIAGGTAPAILNAANEAAVSSFLAGELRFDQIHLMIDRVMSKLPFENPKSLDIIQEADAAARAVANKLISKGKT